jgi:HMG (high mobility group) box
MEDSFATSFASSEEAIATGAATGSDVDEEDADQHSVGDPSHHHHHDSNCMLDRTLSTAQMSSVESMLSFLCNEADSAEERAKRLRDQAKTLAEQFGIDFDQFHRKLSQQDTSRDMAPLDEHGHPKYKGKKRGRKPRPRQRKHNPDREKRRHTGYTLFVQETHPLIKNDNLQATNAQIVSIVAKRWRDLSESQRRQWKARALATPLDNPVMHDDVHNNDGSDQVEYPNVDTMGEGNHGDGLPVARKRTRNQK